MNDDLLDDDPGSTIGVVPTGPDWSNDPEGVKDLTDAVIRRLDEQKANGGSDSGSTFTPAEQAAASHLDEADTVAATYTSPRIDHPIRVRLAWQQEIIPGYGEQSERYIEHMLASGTAITREALLVLLHADDTVIISGEDGCIPLTLGKDFGYDPERRRWIPRSRGPKFKT